MGILFFRIEAIACAVMSPKSRITEQYFLLLDLTQDSLTSPYKQFSTGPPADGNWISTFCQQGE